MFKILICKINFNNCLTNKWIVFYVTVLNNKLKLSDCLNPKSRV